jgi:hypothetical protein
MLKLIEPPSPSPVLSPLMLADQLLDLAKAADAAGMDEAANRLLLVIDRILTRPAGKPGRPAAHFSH